jgi:putative transposon-encoded protein
MQSKRFKMQIIKQIKKIGHGAHVLIPKKYVGRLAQILISEEAEDERQLDESENISNSGNSPGTN